MTNMTDPQVKLYPHAPSTLLPLLRSQLPHTLSLVATILANRHSDADPAPVVADDVRIPPPLPPVYATFPPHSSDVDVAYLSTLGVDAHGWLVAVALPAPSEQLRFYHAVAAKPGYTADELAQAESVVEAALRTMAEMYPSQLVAGCTHEMFEPTARNVLGGDTHDATFIYVAPGGGFGHTQVDTVGGWEEELVLDHGRESDKSLIFKHNHYRLEEYYGARAAHITVLRPTGPGTPPPEVFVQCHGDGSLGALHTQPAYRRRGLAKVVLAAHLAKYEARGVPGYCYIEEHNTASMALFESLGWARLPWVVYWVFEKSVQDSG